MHLAKLKLTAWSRFRLFPLPWFDPATLISRGEFRNDSEDTEKYFRGSYLEIMPLPAFNSNIDIC